MCKESMQEEIINNKKNRPPALFFYRNPDEKRGFFLLGLSTLHTAEIVIHLQVCHRLTYTRGF